MELVKPCARWTQPAHRQGIIGILYTSVAFGTLTGPSAAGFAFDVSHSYAVPILASVCANIIAAGIMAVTSKAGTVGTPCRGR